MTGTREGIPPEERGLDLAALSAARNPGEMEALVARIVDAAAPELSRRAARRRAPAATLSILSGWARPILAAAAVVAALSTGALRWAPGSGASPEGGETELLPEVLGLPTTVATWLDEDRAPTTRELVLAIEEGDGWR